MPIDIFEEKLGKMIEKRWLESEKTFDQEIREIAYMVQESIIDDECKISEDDLLEALELCKDCAKTCDAAENLCKYIFQNENCKRLKENVSIETIKCTWKYDYDEFCDKIEYIFQDEGLDTKKGFVYIFWTAAPLEYLYVGKTDIGVERLKNKRHPSVVRSIETDQATSLTIIYPNKKDIANVEVSLIKIIENLKYNKQEEPFEGDSFLSQKLSRLEKLFGYLHRNLK